MSETVLDQMTQRLTNAAEGSGYEQAIALRILELSDTLLRKNADYGSAVFSAPCLALEIDPDVAILVRMSDKIARLRNLLPDCTQDVDDESIEDTMRDLAGYAILYLVSKEA